MSDYPEIDIILNRVRTAVALTLDKAGYIDGYLYGLDEWILQSVWYHPKSNCYYAWIEVDSRVVAEALYEIDANEEDWGTENGAFAVNVGRWEVERPEDCEQVQAFAGKNFDIPF